MSALPLRQDSRGFCLDVCFDFGRCRFLNVNFILTHIGDIYDYAAFYEDGIARLGISHFVYNNL